MYISELMKIYLSKIEYRIIAEKEVHSLGLISSETSFSICSFIEDKKYIGLVTKQAKFSTEISKTAKISELAYIGISKVLLCTW